MDTTLAWRKVHIDRMRHTAVVPHEHVPYPPGMMILIVWLRHIGMDVIEQGRHFLLVPYP